MSRPVTHIDFAKGTDIKPAFERSIAAPQQRRDPGKTDGYWLVNDSEERVRAIAEKCGQPFLRIKADFFHPQR